MRPPFSPDAVVAEFAGTLKIYGIRRVQGDRYAELDRTRAELGAAEVLYNYLVVAGQVPKGSLSTVSDDPSDVVLSPVSPRAGARHDDGVSMSIWDA